MPTPLENLAAVKSFTKTSRADSYEFISPKNADLSGKSVFISGASKGIGRATALSYAAAGCSKIAIAARSDLSGLEQEIKEAAGQRQPPKVVSIKLDVTSEDSVKAAAETIAREFDGALDVLINNAGYLETWKPVADSDPTDWWKTWDINIKGSYLCSKYFIPLLLKSDLKTNILTSSFGGINTYPGASAYQTTKFAVCRLAEFMNVEYGDKGLVCFAIHPGSVMTELGSNMPEDMHWLLTDKPALSADTIMWLGKEHRPWLGGRPSDAAGDPPVHASAITILIVDDNSVNRKVIWRICQKYGQAAGCAENGAEAVEAYTKEPGRFRCILMDLHMPVMGGAEATRHIRAFEENHNVRRAVIIGLRANGMNPEREIPKYIDAGFDALATKPIGFRLFDELLCGPPENNIIVHTFEFKKVLGFGGFGVAIKFEQFNNFNHEHLRYFVAKIPKDQADDDLMNGFNNEMHFYMRFQVSEHIPRLIDLRRGDYRDDDSTKPAGDSEFWKHDTTRNIMILEYLEHGNLQDLLFRMVDEANVKAVRARVEAVAVNDPNDEAAPSPKKRKVAVEDVAPVLKTPDPIPDRVLWRFFRYAVLTRSCIAFAWPRRRESEVEELISTQQSAAAQSVGDHGQAAIDVQDDKDDGSDEDDDIDDDDDEVECWHEVPPEAGAPSCICHFDTDPSNVFIGNPEASDAEHALHPIVKLADYNLMEEVKRDTNVFFLRGLGKKTTVAPFDRAIGPRWQDFGAHTNVWGIGLVRK
ncbi:short chain dehydrogenase reductase [Seiridium cupressi]